MPNKQLKDNEGGGLKVQSSVIRKQVQATKPKVNVRKVSFAPSAAVNEAQKCEDRQQKEIHFMKRKFDFLSILEDSEKIAL